jgi:hypothetical protein
MILNVIDAMISSINLRIASIGHMPLLKDTLLSTIPPKSGRRNKKGDLRKNVI